MKVKIAAMLLAGSSIGLPSTALAQDVSGSPAAESPAALDSTEARIVLLQTQVDALQRAIEEMKTPPTAAAPVWKGAPQLQDSGSGWTFKPRGRLQYDVATVGSPAGIDNPGLGFSNEVRRARLGVEGSMPGNFGYKFEVDVATGEVEFADAYLSYEHGDVEFIVGQHNNFQSLEELTSSLHTSFIERAAFTDAFNFERRAGVSAQYGRGPVLLQAGVFTDSIADLNAVGDDNDSYGFDTRAVFAPKIGTSQLHFGGSYHWRDINDAATSVRYRQRPAVHSTDVRFVNTGNIADAETETNYGLEAGGIFGPLYAAAEAHWQTVSRLESDDATFFGAYADIGYFITRETRGYKSGKFDRVTVARPFGKGGFGSVAVNLRWDYLSLKDRGIVGGKQSAYQASLNWKPTDHVLFGLNYAHLDFEDAAIPAGDGGREYGIDVIGLRSQIDF